MHKKGWLKPRSSAIFSEGILESVQWIWLKKYFDTKNSHFSTADYLF